MQIHQENLKQIKNNLYCLQEEYALVYFAGHFSVNIAVWPFAFGFQGALKYLTDTLYLKQQHTKFNWEQVESFAYKNNMQAQTWAYLWAAKKYLEFTVPESVLYNLQKNSSKIRIFFLKKAFKKQVLFNEPGIWNWAHIIIHANKYLLTTFRRELRWRKKRKNENK
jgi:hypothetical protein